MAVNSPMRQNARGFTLVEIAIAIFILMLILMLAVPSLNGVLADRRLRRSLDDFNNLVRRAQERSVTERRAYLISWDKDQLVLHPEALLEGEEAQPEVVPLEKGEAFSLELPAALAKDPPPAWIFWPTGTCEPAVVSFKGADGSWTANYPTLTARAEITRYATR